MSFLDGIIQQQKQATPVKSAGEAPKRWVKKGDIEREREEKVLKEREEMESRKRKAEPSKPIESKPSQIEPNIPPEEVIKKLRSVGEVVTFFGESDTERFNRWQQIEDRVPEEEIHGQKDEIGRMLRKLEDADKSSKKKKTEKKKEEKKKEENKEEEVKKEENNGESVEGPPAEGPSAEPGLNYNVMMTREGFTVGTFKRFLAEWKQQLDERSEVHSRSSSGKLETANYIQTRKSIKPLFRLLKKKEVDADIEKHTRSIAQFLIDREYVKAHDAYLSMAIGNAAWPMGVTMVGIHERSAREKIHSNQTAHIMNDEVQRKYIQAVKRIMTFCQNKYPTDPSKSVG
ncbi:hypothetical protein PROFUN_13357 [Planoprotostelium fungivorum]|uniref:Pre-mRNA-splicing factor 18 n=1 Tax=Planoprotostelium fungivorum TaxID=1890364 RepID=A0A2P6N436_9EUKA|nr:hypothetical protein PROFUN_13357 [Planoprotostelium fungivorum]